jgi:hypothetical protein
VQNVLDGDVYERSRCSLQRGSRSGVTVRAEHGEAVQQQVKGARSARQPRECLDRAADLTQNAPGLEIPRSDECRAPRGELSLAREDQIKRL